MEYVNYYDSPLGKLKLTSDGDFLTGIWYENQKYSKTSFEQQSTIKDIKIFEETKKWLDMYFSGKNPNFTPKIKVEGSDFRKLVWNILLQIPYGDVTTYGEIAKIVASKKNISRMSAQAVGNAVGHNPVSIIIPCHRVLGSDGKLTGYAGGLDKKEKLLKLEKIDWIKS